MEIDLKTLSPWADVSRMLLNAKTLTINGYSGTADIENVDGHLSITFAEMEHEFVKTGEGRVSWAPIKSEAKPRKKGKK